MNTHNYLIRVKDEHWEDIQRVKTLWILHESSDFSVLLPDTPTGCNST